MATKSKKKPQTKATSTRKKQPSKKHTKKKQNNEKSFVVGEISILISLAICILMLISNFGFGGFLGDMVSSILFGVFGFLAYVIPILLFVGIAFVISNPKNIAAYCKLTAGAVFTMMGCTFIQLLTTTNSKTIPLLKYYTASAEHHNGGGIIGGFFVRLLCPAIGLIGTYVVIIIVSIICFVLITGKSFLGGVSRGSKKAYVAAKEDALKRKEQAIQRKEEKMQARALKRTEKQVSGVSFATTLHDDKQDMKELKAPKPVEEFPTMSNVEPLIDMPPIFSMPEEGVSSVEDEKAPVVEEQTIEQAPAKQRKKKEKVDLAEETSQVEAIISEEKKNQSSSYQIPPFRLLKHGTTGTGDSTQSLKETALKLEQTLKNFGVNVTITNISRGPSVTRFELQPEQGVKVSKIVGLTDDIKLNLAAADIRIEAPIPGKAAVGIEVPNKETTPVFLRDLLESQEFQSHPSNIAFAAGRNIAGKAVVADIQKMPHVLIAGATGSGKSVCINTLIMSILYKADPKDVKLIMVDPKVVELSVYNGIPHLMIPVVTDPKKASGALNWAVVEMEKRYQLFAQYNVRDLKGYNEKVETIQDLEDETKPEKMPQIVIIVDELADLMMVAPGEVETAICRLAQLARAAGIHLVLATQRPSVNVITGLIKANMPSRIAFAVSSGVDSRTIIDMNGAEKLLGKGDMLFYPSGYQKPARVQGAFVSDKEVQAVVEFLKENNTESTYDPSITEHMDQISTSAGVNDASSNGMNERDVYFKDAGRFIIEKDKASIGMLQRVFKIGFNRAARIMDQLAEAGVVGEEEGTKPRKVLMSMEEFERYIEECI